MKSIKGSNELESNMAKDETNIGYFMLFLFGLLLLFSGASTYGTCRIASECNNALIIFAVGIIIVGFSLRKM